MFLKKPVFFAFVVSQRGKIRSEHVITRAVPLE
jgi:hypothetical protein